MTELEEKQDETVVSSQQQQQQQQQLSEGGAKQLLELMIRRGYFHSDSPGSSTIGTSSNTIHHQLDPTTISTLEDFQEWQQQQQQQQRQSTKSRIYSTDSTTECHLVPNLSGTTYYSPHGLAKVLLETINANVEGGKLLLSHAANAVHVSERYLQEENSLTRRALVHDFGVQILSNINQDPVLVTPRYWISFQNQVQRLVQEKGMVRITDVAQSHDWPMEVVWTHLVMPKATSTSVATSAAATDAAEAADATTAAATAVAVATTRDSDDQSDDTTTTTCPFYYWTVTWHGGSQVLVSQSYLKQLYDTVLTTFQTLHEPILVSKVCSTKDRGWDLDVVVEWLKRAGPDITTGDLHIDHSNQPTQNNNNNNNNNNSKQSTATSYQTAMFTPHVYTQGKRQALMDFWNVNGYLTAETARRQGVLPHQMIKWMSMMIDSSSGNNEPGNNNGDSSSSSSSSSIVVLGGDVSNGGENIVLMADHILQSVQVAIQECCNTTTTTPIGTCESTASNLSNDVVDLQDYLPLNILSQPETVRLILKHVGFLGTDDSNTSNSNISNNKGVAVVTVGEAMIVSTRLVQTIQKTILPPLIQGFAKSQAEALYNAATNTVTSDSANTATALDESSKKGKKGKINKGKKAKTQETTSTTGSSSTQVSVDAVSVVPLLQVAGAILKAYPEWMPEGTEEQLLEQAEQLSWEDEDEDDENHKNSILLVQFCKSALYTDQFQTQCRQAISAELQRLQSVKQSKASLSRKDAAAKVRSVDAAFEDAFATACYMIQAMSKFRTLATTQAKYLDASAVALLEQEMLQGCCADLTSRVTQYCLFQNEEEGGIFTFDHLDNSSPNVSDGKDHDRTEEHASHVDTLVMDLPSYCQPLDTAIRRYSKTYLSCPPPREPLPILRESLPGTIGVPLARQWILCGGECYRGGVKQQRTDEDNKNNDDESADDTTAAFVRPGNLEAFLNHVEENCLTMCGLPFKKLDKKSEKQFLFDRRLRLIQILESINDHIDPAGVLDVTIMLLFQQVKQVVVCGSLLRGPILQMLLHERKITPPVAAVLTTLANSLQTGDPVNESLVASVKECGLCRDIAKLQLEGYGKT